MGDAASAEWLAASGGGGEVDRCTKINDQVRGRPALEFYYCGRL